MSRTKTTAVKDIDIDIADILGQKYLHRIDIGHGDINPPLIVSITTAATTHIRIKTHKQTELT